MQIIAVVGAVTFVSDRHSCLGYVRRLDGSRYAIVVFNKDMMSLEKVWKVCRKGKASAIKALMAKAARKDR